MFILRAFQRGADGVILCGCHPGDCHYTTGNYYARRRMTLLFSMLDYLGIEKERTRVEWVSAAEGAKFAADDERICGDDYQAGREQEIGGSEMQAIVMAIKDKAQELLAGRYGQTGCSAGRRANLPTTSRRPFSDGGGAGRRLRIRRLLRRTNLSQISNRRNPAKRARCWRFLKPCDTYSFNQLLKEHRIWPGQRLCAVASPATARSMWQRLKVQGHQGHPRHRRRMADGFTVHTLYGDKNGRTKAMRSLERCLQLQEQEACRL